MVCPKGGTTRGLLAGTSSWCDLVTSTSSGMAEAANAGNRNGATAALGAAAPKARPGNSVLFWGGVDGRPAGVDGYVRREGDTCTVVDILNDPAMDLSDEAVAEAWETRIRQREWHSAGFSVVCSSLSRALHPRVRNHRMLWGLLAEHLPPRLKKMTGAQYLAHHNRMLVHFLRLLWAALQTGMEVWAENPADALPRWRADRVGVRNPFHDRRAATSASLFRFPEMIEVMESHPGLLALFPQCPHGSRFWKPTAIWATGEIATAVQPLDGTACSCVPGTHRPARGNQSKESQEYPDGISSPLGTGMVRANRAVQLRWG